MSPPTVGLAFAPAVKPRMRIAVSSPANQIECASERCECSGCHPRAEILKDYIDGLEDTVMGGDLVIMKARNHERTVMINTVERMRREPSCNL